MTSNETLLCAAALTSWQQVIERASRKFNTLDDSKMEMSVAPDRNRIVYLLGHLTVAHDRMLPLLRIGERMHPELDASFFDNPDGQVPHSFTIKQLRGAWDEVNSAVTSAMKALTPAEWLERHASVDENTFKSEPSRNRMAILLSRTNHLSFHVGQIILVK